MFDFFGSLSVISTLVLNIEFEQCLLVAFRREVRKEAKLVSNKYISKRLLQWCPLLEHEAEDTLTQFVDYFLPKVQTVYKDEVAKRSITVSSVVDRDLGGALSENTRKLKKRDERFEHCWLECELLRAGLNCVEVKKTTSRESSPAAAATSQLHLHRIALQTKALELSRILTDYELMLSSSSSSPLSSSSAPSSDVGFLDVSSLVELSGSDTAFINKLLARDNATVIIRLWSLLGENNFYNFISFIEETAAPVLQLVTRKSNRKEEKKMLTTIKQKIINDLEEQKSSLYLSLRKEIDIDKIVVDSAKGIFFKQNNAILELDLSTISMLMEEIMPLSHNSEIVKEASSVLLSLLKERDSSIKSDEFVYARLINLVINMLQSH